MVNVEKAIQIFGRGIVRSVGIGGVINGLKSESTAQTPGGIILEKASRSVGYGLLEVVAPYTHNAFIEAAEKGWGKLILQGAAGIGIDLLAIYQIAGNSGVGQLAEHIAHSVGGLNVLASTGSLGAFLAARIVLNVVQNWVVDSAGTAIARQNDFASRY